MPLKTHQPEEPTLNLAPMIDIVLLLVIFFMVGTQFTEADRQYEIELPTVSVAQPLTGLPDELVINIGQDGTVYFRGQTIAFEALKRELQTARQRFADQAVIIRGDAEVPYQRVMDVLSLCQQVRMTNVQLANRLQDEGTP
jgi:biopolymer transport protein ExbD